MQNSRKYNNDVSPKVDVAPALVNTASLKSSATNLDTTVSGAGRRCSPDGHCEENWDDDFDGSGGGTSEFRINTGFRIGLHWRPIRTKQKIKKVLFYLPKKVLSTSKHVVGKFVLEKKLRKSKNSQESDGFDEDSDYDYDYDYDYDKECHGNEGFDNDSDEHYSCDESSDESIDYEYYGNDADTHRIKDHAISVHASSSNAKRNKVQQERGKKKFKPTWTQSLDSGDDPDASIGLKKNSSYQPSKEITIPDPTGYSGQSNDNLTINNEKSDEVRKIETEAFVAQVGGDLYHSEEVSSQSNDEQVTHLSALELKPEYILISTSILVNEVCEHMPNQFRSDDQQEGRSEDIQVVIFDDPKNTSTNTSSKPPKIEHHAFFPGDSIFSASNRASFGFNGYLLSTVLSGVVVALIV